MKGCLKRFAPLLLTLGVLSIAPDTVMAQEKSILRVVPQANLTVLDPVWTTAFVTRNHGFMVYDTLFGTDANGDIKPQMVETWAESPDHKQWTFTLQQGLEFHDGAPVTSADVVASLKRWAARDTIGRLLADSVASYETPNALTFVLNLNKPFGIMLDALGKPTNLVPFIMPSRIAATSPNEQIKEVIGSGPYRFVAEEYRSGERVVYEKNLKYRPRNETPSGTAGGKNVYIDRVEWVILRDPQTQLNALTAGEVDIIEQPTFEQYPALRKAAAIKLVNTMPDGRQFYARLNHLHPPFDNLKIRQAAMVALGQREHLLTQVGDPDLFKFCKSLFPCGTPYSSDDTSYYTGKPDPKRAKELLAEAGYKNQPVVLLRPTDLAMVAKLPLVTKQQLEAAGFKVDIQQSDWATVVTRRAKKDAPTQGGWSIFETAGDSDPNPLARPALNASGQNGWFGWQDDPELERLKAEFVEASTLEQRQKIAQRIQIRAIDTVSYIPLGQFINPAAVREDISGILPAGAQIYWNIRKK
ncbi:ABC transporter substrate-binding protein [Pollutimonas bauzanensis]|uniref:ABC transporter substrate-binding protein n=1 Tax=Pollutimonas bauzanensis TaxID=658167 RepID=UPI00333E9FC0